MKEMRSQFFSPESQPPENSEQIKYLQDIINRAIRDGILSRKDHDQILQVMYSDGKVSREESHLFQELQTKIWKGEIALEG